MVPNVRIPTDEPTPKIRKECTLTVPGNSRDR